jgi:NodT family efflux transporter outer membrane factor (OMF) lipoprotein
MLLSRTLISFAVVSIASGCAVGPDYSYPTSHLPDNYLARAAAEPQQPSVQTDFANWWAGFGDPQLTRYITIALERNLDLEQASARVMQARAGIGAANAALLPAGAVSTQVTRGYQSLETPLGQVLNAQPGFDRHGNAYEANVGVGWELDLFGGLRRVREAAIADYQASEAAKVATRLAVAAQTADIYISIRGLQARLEIARSQEKTQQELLDLFKLLYSKGLVAEMQVKQIEGTLAPAEAAVPILLAALETSMNAFDVMLGAAPGTYRQDLAEPRALPSSPQISSTGSPAELLRRRPDLIVAERRLASSNARIGMAIAEYYPKFTFSGMVGSSTSLSAGELFSGGANQGAGMLGLRWRLFDFGRIDAQIDRAKGLEAEALAAYRLAVLRATADVENALTDLVKREQQTNALKRGVDSLTQAREASVAAYQKGVVSRIEVLQADASLLRSADQWTQADTESSHAAVATFKALGGGWDPLAAPSFSLR